jgi:serine/threonine protein kinase
MESYSYTRDIEDYRFGRAQLWTKKGTKDRPEYAIVKEKWSMTESDYVNYNKYMQTRRNIHNENLASVFTSDNKVDNSWCSKYYKTLIAMEYSEESLAEELHRRRRLTRDDPGKWMSEPEMWYVIRAVANGCATLESHGLLHGDIQPRHILIMPDETIKLFEAPLLSQYFNGYNRMLQEQDYNAALSPQELDALRSDDLYRTLNPGLAVHQPVNSQFTSGIQGILDDKKIYNDQVKNSNLGGQFQDRRIRYVHNEKDEVFALGITALCAACNNPLTDFYDMKTLTLAEGRIGQKLAFMRELGYSPQLINLITGMLNINPQQRPSLAQILSVVNQPYSVIGNNGQIIGQAHPGPITGPSTMGPGFPGNAPVMPGQPAPPVNPGMAAFQQGVPQRQPMPMAGPGPAPGPGFAPQPQPLNPGMAAFQGSNFGATTSPAMMRPSQQGGYIASPSIPTAAPRYPVTTAPAPVRTY